MDSKEDAVLARSRDKLKRDEYYIHKRACSRTRERVLFVQI